jgi:hypothetical protein
MAAVEVIEAKRRARDAYQHAKATGGLASALADRVWSETLLAIEKQRAANQAEMLNRTTNLFGLLIDRQSWAEIKPRGEGR